MASSRELIQSVLAAMSLAQNALDDLLATPGVSEILKDMDDLGQELTEVLE